MFTSQVGQGSNIQHNAEILVLGASSSSRIPQMDGPIPDPYDDVLSTPNVSSSTEIIILSCKRSSLYFSFFLLNSIKYSETCELD